MLLTHHHRRLMKEGQQVASADPRQPYVPPGAFLMVRFRKDLRATLRRLLADDRRLLLQRCFAAFRKQAFITDPDTDRSLCLRIACAVRALSLSAKELKVLLCLGKRAYLTSLSEQFKETAQGRDWQNLWQALACFRPNQGTKKQMRPLLAVRGEQGQVLQDADGVALRWSRHFAAIEGGSLSSFASLVSGYVETWRPDVAQTLSALPSRLEWESTFRTLPKGKAAGADGLSTD